MQSTDRNSPSTAGNAMATQGPGGREAIARQFAAASENDKAALAALMTDPSQDDTFFSGLELFLNNAAAARFLHTLKLEKLGEWAGNTAPARLQIRLMEIAKSSHHPAYQAFRAGVVRSGGLERAYPKA